jgi:hypothetical protein
MATQEIAKSHPLVGLHELGRAARQADSAAELEFIAVNDTRTLLPYRQAALWLEHSGIKALSGVVKLESQVPYVQWLNKVCSYLSVSYEKANQVVAADLPDELSGDWSSWLPARAVWVPFKCGDILGGLLYVRDLAWADSHIALLTEWVDIWTYCWKSLTRPPLRWPWQKRRADPLLNESPQQTLRTFFNLSSCKAFLQTGAWRKIAWWKQPKIIWTLAAVMALIFPVRLTVLAPGELVPANPAVIRASLDGVIATFYVQPNEFVQKDQPLFSFDNTLIKSQLGITRQALATAQAEYRQAEQQALTDSKVKVQLPIIRGRIDEKIAELAYMTDQLSRSEVLAPQNGIALFDDPSEWIGKPVTIGERVMRIASLDDVEIQAWVGVADAIDVRPGAPVALFLRANPTSPVDGKLRYFAHEAVERPDMTYAYRLRAVLDKQTHHRVGLKGTAKLYGRWVPLVYWAMRRPIASLRTTIGW